jgi:hypothetical protein
MTESELKQAKRTVIRRRIIAMRTEIGLPAWDIKDTNRLTRRIADAPGDGIADFDLRVMVRWFNRELLGKELT